MGDSKDMEPQGWFHIFLSSIFLFFIFLSLIFLLSIRTSRKISRQILRRAVDNLQLREYMWRHNIWRNPLCWIKKSNEAVRKC